MKTIPCTLWLLASLAGATASVAAQNPIGETGPSLPPALRKQGPSPTPTGAALQTHAMQKLKIRFEQADTNGDGRMSRDEAKQGGFGFIVEHFDAIDTAQRGSVTFDELTAFTRSRRH